MPNREMYTTKLRFDDSERLRQILDMLIDEFAARIISLKIVKGFVVVEMDQEATLLGYGEEELWDQLRRVRIASYEYMGTFSLAVVKEIFRTIKQQGLVPSYLLIHPESALKRTSEWLDLSITTMADSTFFGLTVVESGAIDEESFIVAAGHSPRAAIPNIVLGVKGQINAIG